MQTRASLIEARDLFVKFTTYRGVIKALNGIELWLNQGERLGIVGETGCGKSVTALALMQLIEYPGEISGGNIHYDGQPILSDGKPDGRGAISSMAMIFQDPIAALNPVFSVGFQIAENIASHRGLSRRHYRSCYPQAATMLEKVGLDAVRTINLYPHELSGGMAQRVMIAMALAAGPKLLIADEATSALDVTIQAQILRLLDQLIAESETSVIFVTHDMGVAAQFCDKIMVMYAGNTVEFGNIETIFANPAHPYSRGLLQAVPRVGRREELAGISGQVPDLVNPPAGCRFHPRCSQVMPECSQQRPQLRQVATGHHAACYLYKGE